MHQHAEHHAVGDVIVQLTPVAGRNDGAGRRSLRRAWRVDYLHIPTAVFTIPTSHDQPL
jgi:hypothetical protein